MTLDKLKSLMIGNVKGKVIAYDDALLSFCLKYIAGGGNWFWGGKAFYSEPIEFIRPIIIFNTDFWTKSTQAKIYWEFRYPNISCSPTTVYQNDIESQLKAIRWAKANNLYIHDGYYSAMTIENDRGQISWSDLVMRGALDYGAEISTRTVWIPDPILHDKVSKLSEN